MLRRTLLVALAVMPVALHAMAEQEELETVELIPEDRAGIGPANLFAPITGFFLGGSPAYWYSPRKIEVRTTPPGAVLDLFYVRRSFQKAYEQADAPVMLVLPSRNEAGSHDSVKIRAFLDGYQQGEVSVPVRSRTKQVMIDLEPLSNSLKAVTHLHFADRTTLNFLSTETVTLRSQERDGRYALIFVETGSTPEAVASMEGLHDPLVESLSSQQLGTDLVVTLALTERAKEGGVDVRQRQSYDPIRRLHTLRIDVVPKVTKGSPVQRAKAALARIGPGSVTGCAVRFDDVLHARLDHSALARALTPSGAPTDPYMRAAMKRLGEISPDGAVVLTDGTTYRTHIPLELAAATSQAAEVRGYLAMLRSFVAELEAPPYRRGTLRGLIAPEVSPKDFDAMLDSAEAAERTCLASAG